MAEQQESRREILAKSLDEAVSKASEPAAEAAPPPEPTQTEQPLATARSRDESGKFAKADEKKASGASSPSDAPKVGAVAVSDAKAARKYPSTWKRDYEPVYRKLEANPEFSAVLDEIERRENDHLKQIGQYKPNVEFATTIRKALEPYQQTFQQLNMQPEQAIQRLLQTDHQLRTAPEQARPALMMQLLQSYGMTPEALQAAPQVDPTVYALQNQLQQTQQKVDSFMTSIQRDMEKNAQTEIESFREGHPFLDDVREDMAKLIQHGMASSLQEAYEKATYASPVTRNKVLAEQQAKAEAERRQREQQRTDQAKSAAVQVKGAPTGGPNSAASKAKDRRSLIAEAIGRATNH